MANNEYGVRFTEEKYATKNEVIKDLKFSMIEPIWSQILKYRSNFNNYLTIKNSLNSPFVFCQCESMKTKLDDVKNSLIKINEQYAKIVSNSSSNFDYTVYNRILHYYAKYLKMPIDEGTISNIIKGFTQAINFNNKLTSFYNALKFLSSYEINFIDENFTLEIYKKISGNPSLSTAYRFDENKLKNNNFYYNLSNDNVPSNAIVDMMNNLYAFIQNDDEAYVFKSFICYFYILYVKPFVSFNEEMAVLLAKCVLSLSPIGNQAFKVPYERIIFNCFDDAIKIINEVKRTNDITYFINYCCLIISDELQKGNDFIYNFSAQIIKDDYFKPDDVAKSDVVEEQPIATAPLKNDDSTQKVTSKVESIDTYVPPSIEAGKIAVGFIPAALSDEDALRLETFLLESDPLLSKKQARFYARHCTIGKMYTISQFKDYNNCVYETARSSMDGLVDLKYYRKLKIKNKFVYTPIERK